MNPQKTNEKIWFCAAIGLALILLAICPQSAVAQSNTFPNSGNVGIGTTSPSQLLHVEKDQDASTMVLVRNATAGTAAQANVRILNDAGKFGQLGIYSSLKTPYGAATANDVHLYSSTSLAFMADATNGIIKFATGGNSERMRIDSSGNVGIGTTNPTKSLLHIKGAGTDYTASTYTGMAVEATDPTKYASVDFVNDAGFAGAPQYQTGLFGSNHAIANFRNYGFLVNSTAAGGILFATQSNERMRIDQNGNVGIGTTSPANKLHVAGGITVDGIINAKYQDVAEWVESSQALPAGTVVVLDHTRSNQVISSTQSYDTRVAGVISKQPGIALGESGDNKVLVATTGRVRMKVDASRAPIHIGDLLVTSDLAGMAMKSKPVSIGGIKLHRPGTLIGKALEPLAKGTGEILVLLSLQ